MKINDRLKKIGDLVDTNSLVLDIGCDHALLDIYLVKEKGFQKVIASDIGEGPLESARENIKKYKLENNIKTRIGDGLSTYTDDIDTAIISGMGGRTIIGIFKSNIKITKCLKQIILSPNNYQEDVRKFFSNIGFYIEDESLVKEGRFIYQVIKLKKGKKHYKRKEYFFGPVLLAKKDKLFKEYFTRELKSREILINILPKNYRLKKYKVSREIKNIQNELNT